MKIYDEGTHQKCLNELLLMSTHTVCFCGKIRKMYNWIPLVSRAIMITDDDEFNDMSTHKGHLP